MYNYSKSTLNWAFVCLVLHTVDTLDFVSHTSPMNVSSCGPCWRSLLSLLPISSVVNNTAYVF